MQRGVYQLLFAATVLFAAVPAQATWTTVIVRHARSAAPSARDLAAKAQRQRVDAAMRQFLAAHTLALRDHPLTIDIDLARQTLVKAQSDVELYVADARVELRKSDDYRKLLIADQTLRDKIGGEKDAEARVKLATQRLALRQQLSKVENAAIAANARVASARASAAEARTKILKLENERQIFLTKTPEFVAAKDQLTNARSALVASR